MSPLESPESSSPLVARAVAAALRDDFCDAYSLPQWQRAALNFLGVLPRSVALWAMPRAQAPIALAPASLDYSLMDTLIKERLSDYAALPGRFPSITIGVPIGGAAAHLAVSLGGPFLPQAFVLTLAGGALDGNVQEYLHRSNALAQQIVDANPDLITIQHYDPVHDGWLTRRVNHLRLKLIALPEAYVNFIRQRLMPGGEIIYLEGQALWQRYRLAERRVFQVGGWGDISSAEFLAGSDRLDQYCRSIGFAHSNWRLDDYPLEWGPESEWGSEPGLAEALEQFCRQAGYQFRRISLPHPHDFSRLAFYAMAQRLRQAGRQPAGVLIEMFSQYDVTSVERLGLLPFWLIFNTEDSRQFLQSMLPKIDPALPLYFSILSTFSLTPDLVPWQDWEQTLSRTRWMNIGARKSHYPADTRAVLHWSHPLRVMAQGKAASLPCLNGQDLQNLVDDILNPVSMEGDSTHAKN